jgi:hypothetical protein
MGEIGGACGMNGSEEKYIQNLNTELEGRRMLGKPKRKQDNNIKMHLKERGWENVDYVRLARGRDHWRAVVNTLMNVSVA